MGYVSPIGLYIPDFTVASIAAHIIGILLFISAALTDTTPYSKFGKGKIPSRPAMLWIYSPAVLACLLIQLPTLQPQTQADLLHLLIFSHFTKRVIEVIFVHIYHSKTDLESVISISLAYASISYLDVKVVQTIPASVFSEGWTRVGLVLFVVGEISNGYHHWLLRKIRLGPEMDSYRLPVGGLFDWVIAPHYASEQLAFIGLFLVGQNSASLAVRAFPLIYLTVRAKKTRDWYEAHLTDKQEKLELQRRKNLIPFIW